MSGNADSPPTRDEVAQKLRQLASGELTPQAASDWATPWITKFLEIDPPLDPKVERALVALSGADLLGDPNINGALLHGQDDFESWLREFLE